MAAGTPIMERKLANYVDAHVTFQPIVDNNGVLVGEWTTDEWTSGWHHKSYVCFAIVCPCVSLGQIMSRVGSCGEGYVLMVLCFYVILAIFVVVWASFLHEPHGVLNVWFYLAIGIGFMTYLTTGAVVGCARTKLRQLFKIPGSDYMDIAAATCCTSCVLTQMATHVHATGGGACNLRFKDTLPGYDV
ncbi:Aste57867_8168 [Aphanomyces stellatus]|uniref:Aste57867_8168 protein n=1 Tax=Aphanomyces stellatus TaxID=120398 RepID=A0A485KJJ9_9STRA|nr:hypothetical protein As57867_008138 [Aphanomyces stellatus]VFT85056.1 Aste57867_8168 [Aphanomyces stellatus]